MTASGQSGSDSVGDTLVGTTAGASRSAIATLELAKGTIVGRYVVVDVVGTGAMGIVYAAYDPELGRRVALKLLRHTPSSDAPSGSIAPRDRGVAEAQALAKLNHPNVVAIHDVGTTDDRVWIAMEFVEGRTLSAWLRAAPRTWTEIVEVMCHAGRGLAAAHSAGLLHRDFKPDNVMIGDDGRVRVMDFGLARPRQNDEGDIDLEGASGTPAYMSRELFDRREPDARSDQFSFAVTLWEALYGERPFGGTSIVELAAAIVDGRARTPPRDRAVPQWLRRVCVRGISSDREDRFASMDALLDALERGRARARLRGVAIAIGAVGVLVAAVLGWRQWDERLRIAACDAAGAEITSAWNDDVEDRVRAGLVATNVSYAQATAEKVIPWLDAQAKRWATHRTSACTLASVEHRWDDELLDRATWCLDERRIELDALVAALVDADDKIVQRAVSGAAGLTPISPCIDEAALRSLPSPPPRGPTRDAIASARVALEQSAALQLAGRFTEGLDLARQATETATGLDWPPLVAAGHLREGVLLVRTGAYAEAEQALITAYMDAAAASAWDTAADAAIVLVELVGYRLQRHAEGEVWARHAAIATAKGGDPLALREASRLGNLGLVAEAKGDPIIAADLHRRALAIKEAAFGTEHPSVARTLNNLGNSLKESKAFDDAAMAHERALVIWETALGPEHPDVAASLANLANTFRGVGDDAQARALLERALRIQETALDPMHPDLAATLNNLANIDKEARDWDAAAPRYERALAIFEKSLGAEHPRLSIALANLASVHHQRHAHAVAGPLYERALSIRERALGADHPDVAKLLVEYAAQQYDEGRIGDARRLLDRALVIYDATPGEQEKEESARVLLRDVARAEARAEP